MTYYLAPNKQPKFSRGSSRTWAYPYHFRDGGCRMSAVFLNVHINMAYDGAEHTQSKRENHRFSKTPTSLISGTPHFSCGFTELLCGASSPDSSSPLQILSACSYKTGEVVCQCKCCSLSFHRWGQWVAFNWTLCMLNGNLCDCCTAAELEMWEKEFHELHV